MALPKYGVRNNIKQTRRKRKGRISKRPNKHSKNFKRKKYRGQGR